MSEFNCKRRDFLKSGVVGGVGLGANLPSGFLPASTDNSSPFALPAEASTLLSKAYGRKRLEKVQRAIKANRLDGLIVSNRALDYISYVSNLHPFPLQPAVGFIPAEGRPLLFVHMYSPAHTRALKPIVWVDLIDIPRDPVSEGSNINLFRECVKRIKFLKLSRGRIGLAGEEVDWLLPFYFHERLPDLRLVDASRMLNALIVIKDEVELSIMRHTQRFIDEVAYPAYQQLLVPHALDTHAYAQVMSRMLENGADFNTMLLFDAAPYSSGTWASGVRNRKLQPGDIILSEPMPTVLGYQTEKMFTFALGKGIPDSQKRGAEVIYESFLLAMDQMKPGREIASIIEKSVNYIRSKGYEGFTVPLGHWIGTQNHEGPRLTAEGTKGWTLKPGMVLSWHPNIVVPGKVRTSCSSCLLITDKGAENMSSIPLQPIYYL